MDGRLEGKNRKRTRSFFQWVNTNNFRSFQAEIKKRKSGINLFESLANEILFIFNYLFSLSKLSEYLKLRGELMGKKAREEQERISNEENDRKLKEENARNKKEEKNIKH